MSKLVFAVHSRDAGTTAAVSDALASTGQVEVLCGDIEREALLDSLEVARVDGLYVDLDRDAHILLDVLEESPKPRPALIFGGNHVESAVLVRAMRLQPLDFLEKHDVRSLPEHVEHVMSVPSLRAVQQGDVQSVLGVAGSKGGVGTTFTACELAAALQRRGERTVVVDLNLGFSDASLYFDLKPAYTLADVARKGENIDGTFLQTALTAHASGVHVLSGPSRAEEVSVVGAIHVERSVELLRETFAWVIVDLPQFWEERSLAALNCADQILLVTRVEVAALKHTKQQLELLERLGAPRDRLRVIVNQMARKSPFTEREVEIFLGRVPEIFLPEDTAAASRCANEGQLLEQSARGSKLQRGFEELADLSRQWVRGGGVLPSEPVSLIGKLLGRNKGGR